MHELSASPPTPHDSLVDLSPQARCSPTPQHPRQQVSLRSSFRNFHDFATVIVGTGPSAVKFVLHKDLLTAHSPFFAAALNGAFAEGLDQTVTLPEEKPETFEWFTWYLYSGSLTTPLSPNCASTSLSALSTGTGVSSSSSVTPEARRKAQAALASSPQITHTDGDLRNTHGSPKYFLLLDLYALSDRLLTTSLSNHILDTMARLSETTNSVPTPSDTWILYDTIRDSAPIRRLILDLFCYKKTDKLLEQHKDEWHSRFLRELVVKLKRPGEESLTRHTLRGWRVKGWGDVRGCEGCRDVLRPGCVGERCEVCERVFCTECVGKGRVVGGVGEVGVCKPWLRGMCARYHDHGGVQGGECE